MYRNQFYPSTFRHTWSVFRSRSARPQNPIDVKRMRTEKMLRWDRRMEEELITVLQDEVAKGHRGQNRFIEEAWNRAVAAVESAAPVVMQDEVTRDKVKNKVENMKRDWRLWDELCSKSGWPIDSNSGCPIGDGMEDFLAAHPQSIKFAKKPLFMAREPEQLFMGTTRYSIPVGALDASPLYHEADFISEESTGTRKRKRPSIKPDSTPGLVCNVGHLRKSQQSAMSVPLVVRPATSVGDSARRGP